jgi:pimeloyl-ACP methyl ester carboxylesterase
MEIIEYGSGDPLVLVPGIQGRWEYMRPAIEALAASFRVITFPLCGEPDSQCHLEPSKGLDNYVAQVIAALDAKRIERAAICGVSFGGLVALRVGACHNNRVAALILASTPAPVWHLRRRHQVYARAPWIFGPVFLAESPWRLRAEIVAAMPDRRSRWSFRRSVLQTFAAAPVSVARMAARARLIDGIDMRGECAAVTAPTLVITGEHLLDHVVPASGSSAYTELIPNARAVVLERTGHLGCVTRPDAFAELLCEFLNGAGKRTEETRTEATGTEASGRPMPTEGYGGNGLTQRNGVTETNGRKNGYTC